jgi:hypothetical protein
MSHSAFAAVLAGLLTVSAPAAQAAATVFEGRIKDVGGTYGTLTLTLGEGQQAKARTFRIREARIVGPTRTEWKVGDLREGDWVEVEMTRDGQMVQEIRFLPGRRTK